MNRNAPIFGLILGIIFPVLGTLVIFLLSRRGYTFGGYVESLMANHKVAAKVLSLSLIGNLIPFIYYTNRRLDLTARGILIATMLYAVLIVLLMFVW